MTLREPGKLAKQPDLIPSTILWGAATYSPGRKVADFNPFPDSPGYVTLHKAFAYGWNNSRQVLWEHECPGEPMPPPNSLIW